MTHKTPIGQLLLQKFRWTDASLMAGLEARGWPRQTRAQSLIFANLDIVKGTRSAELARRIGISRQAIHQTIRELEALGFVEFADDPDNRSAKLVTLTPKGQHIVADALEVFEDIELQLTERIGVSTAKQLRAALEKDWGQGVSQKNFAKEEEQ